MIIELHFSILIDCFMIYYYYISSEIKWTLKSIGKGRQLPILDATHTVYNKPVRISQTNKRQHGIA